MPLLRHPVVRGFVCLAVATFALRAQTAPDAPALPDASAVVKHLNQAIDWHRHLLAQDQVASDATDLLYQENARAVANQALQLSFDFARADADLLAKQNQGSAADITPAPGSRQAVAKAAADADAEVKERQEQLQSLKQQLAAKGAQRSQLQGQIDAMQSELELEQARSQTLHSIASFAGGAGVSGGSLAAQIEELRRTVPELETTANSATPARSSAIAENKPQPSGVVALVEGLFALRRKINTIDDSLAATAALQKNAQDLRRPLIAGMTSTEEEGDKALEESATPAEQKQRIDALTTQFKQFSAVVLPLAKQSVLLQSYTADLQRWRAAVHSEYILDLRRLGIRLGILAIVLVGLLALSELWRKAVFRYVRDVRHRYQFLLLRRIIIWVAIGIAVAFALASEIGSLATFVGLITAGIAVAMQNVIMAMAGYFFLIGKYGVSVGDRVQIGGVSGDVLDIGLIRLHLMEIGGPDAGRQPTGRVVVFSNAIVFQPGASFYKQIPGTHFTWHQVSLTLAPTTDYRAAEKRILGAIESVYGGYREGIERQHRRMQETLNVSVDLPAPRSRLHFTGEGLKIVVRFPVELEKAVEIDDEVTRKILEATNESPRMRLAGSGTLTIEPVSDEPQQKAS